MVTQIVANEFGKPLPNWIRIENSTVANYRTTVGVLLDKGEASSIALALEKQDCLLIIDELRGRKLARQLGITITGTLGVLAQAKQMGVIEALKPVLDKVTQTNFRLSEWLVKETLKQVGE